MAFTEKNIFLFDGIGAVASVVFTGFLLPQFSDSIGLPAWILHRLAILPFIYAVYSLSCYRFSKSIKPWMLLTIIFANFVYCFISTALIFIISSLTNWGGCLLVAEFLVVLMVVLVELKVYQKFFKF